MASLPPGWTADYDGQRWFFTYGPTGQSQFQFPRPGDEFPDLLLCCAGGGAGATDLPAVGLLPEERLESERQVRRLLNAGGGSGGSGAGGSRSTGEVVVDEEEEASLGSDGDGGSTVCFGNFAAVKSRGRQGWEGGREEGTRNVRQRERCVDKGVGIKRTTGVADVSRESSGEPVSVPLMIKSEHAQTDYSSYQEGSAATIAIMGEPVPTAVAPSLGQQGEHQLSTVAQSSPPELPMPHGGAMESAHTPPWVVPVGVIPELYSESTALCEEEINPPPVELPCDEGGWSGQPVLSNMAVQSPIELPAYEGPGVSSGNGSSIALLEPKCLASKSFVGEYATSSTAGRGEAPGGKGRGHDRAGLPSQASRMPAGKSPDKISFRERVNSVPDQKPSLSDTDHPTEKAGTERRDLTHFPSILRPGPRRSGQQRPPAPVVPAPATNTYQATAHVQLFQQPWGQQHEEQVEACRVLREQPARMPAMPLEPQPGEPRTITPTTSPEAPQPGGTRQERLPSSVNFVIPIRHMSSDKPNSSPDIAAAGGDSPEYRVSASFA